MIGRRRCDVMDRYHVTRLRHLTSLTKTTDGDLFVSSKNMKCTNMGDIMEFLKYYS